MVYVYLLVKEKTSLVKFLSLKVIIENYFSTKIFLFTLHVHLALCMRCMRIAFDPYIHTFRQGTRVFWMD